MSGKIIDGFLNDWTNVTFETYVGVDVAIGYDDEYVYVAAEWADNAENDLVSMWNKTGMLETDEAEWDFIDLSAVCEIDEVASPAASVCIVDFKAYLCERILSVSGRVIDLEA